MKRQGLRLTSLLPWLVFALFALCLLGVLLTGAGVYQRISQSSRQQDQRRTAALYLTTRVQQANGLRVEPFGDCDALVFPQQIQGTAYLTRVYCHDGQLKELFSAADADLAPEDGEALLPLAQLEISLDGQILTLDTGHIPLVFSLRTGREPL